MEQVWQLPRTSPDDALTYLSVWFAGLPDTAIVSLFGLPPALPLPIELEELRTRIRAEGLDSLVFSGIAGRGFENIYIGVSPLKKFPPHGKRGTKANIDHTLGVWLDLDTKDDSDPMADARALHALLPPTMVVETGTGGVHLYWRTRPMDPNLGEAMNKRLRLWAQATLRHPLDAVHNPDRVLRLPGTIRFPKKGELGVSPAPVVLRYHEGPHTTPETIEALTAPQWDEHTARIGVLRRALHRDDALALQLMQDSGNRWAAMMTIERMESMINEIPWDQILTPMGWTQFGPPDAEGRVSWTRPHAEGEGLNPRSAIVDWNNSPHVMSLLSEHESTGLRKLADAEIPLTKLRVLAELYYEGSLAALAAVLRNGESPLG